MVRGVEEADEGGAGRHGAAPGEEGGAELEAQEVLVAGLHDHLFGGGGGWGGWVVVYGGVWGV